MANALFRDFTIYETDEAHPSPKPGGRSVVVRVSPDAVERRRDEINGLFSGLMALDDDDIRKVEAVVRHLAQHRVEHEARPIEELLAEDNRHIRDRFVAETSPLRRDDVVRMAQQTGSDGEAVLRQWEAEERIFSVTHHGRIYYPDFQFRDGLPDPTVKAVLSALPPDLSDWQRAFWFVSANGWVHNGAPADHLDDPALVLQAARFEGEPVIG